jgi:hypothetical protein
LTIDSAFTEFDYDGMKAVSRMQFLDVCDYLGLDLDEDQKNKIFDLICE